MPNDARVGDLCVGVCCCHPPIPCIGMAGIILTGASGINVEGSSSSRIGDIVLGGCGHPAVIVSGSGSSNFEGSNDARIGDAHAGCFTGVIAGSASSTDVG